MTANTDPVSDRYRMLPMGASAVAVLIGAGVLVGWTFDVSALKSLSPNWVAMKANTAVGFTLSGIALWTLYEPRGSPRRHRLGQACAVVVALLGAATLGEYLFSWHLGIDELVFQEQVNAIGTSSPGRMASASALNFLLLGVALLLLDAKAPRGLRPAELLVVVVGLIGVLAIVGYAYDVAPFTGFTRYTPLALHTAVAFVALAAGVLFARPERGMMQILTADGAGGISARRLWPFIMVTPFVLGWLRLRGERAGFYETEFGVALTVVATMLLFSAIVWWNARSLNQTDADRKHAEGELQGFFTLSLDMLVIAGFDGYFKRLNPAWQRILGFTKAELYAKPFVDFIHPDDVAATLREAAKVSTEGIDTISFENRYRCSDGSYRWLLWNATAVADRAEFYAVARDITERKRAELALQEWNHSLERVVAERTAALEERAAELAKSNAELEAFTYSVSHDLKEPLRTVEAFSQFVLEDYSDKLDDQGRDYLQKLANASARMKHLIEDLLALSRIGRRSDAPVAVDVGTVVSGIIEGMRAAFDEKGATIEVDDSLPLVAGDASRVEQIFGNLIANGLKFNASERPGIVVGMRCIEDAHAVFYVKDNGIGIDPQYHERIFGIFQRLHRREEYEGTGAGLAIVKRAVEALGGRIWLESALGDGTTFLFALPLAVAEESAQAA